MPIRSRPSTLDDDSYVDNWLNSARQVIPTAIRYGGVCRLCHCHTVKQEICPACKHDLPWYTAAWQQRFPFVDGVSVGFHFDYPIRQLIHRTKYSRDIACARLLGELFAESLARNVSAPSSCALFPVPLARSRMLVRGFNQATEISLPIMQALRLPMDVVSVYKPRARVAQSSLNASKRRANIRGAFKPRYELAVDTAIIVDDVLTTGATISAMARALRSAGAKTVLAWVLAAA